MDKFSLFLVKSLRMQQLDCRFSMFILKQQQQKPGKQFSKAVVPSYVLTSNVQWCHFPKSSSVLGFITFIINWLILSDLASHSVFNLHSLMVNEWESFHILIYHLYISYSDVFKFSTHLKNCFFFVINLQTLIIYPKYKPFIRYIKIFFCIFTTQSVKIGLYAS